VGSWLPGSISLWRQYSSRSHIIFCCCSARRSQALRFGYRRAVGRFFFCATHALLGDFSAWELECASLLGFAATSAHRLPSPDFCLDSEQRNTLPQLPIRFSILDLVSLLQLRSWHRQSRFPQAYLVLVLLLGTSSPTLSRCNFANLLRVLVWEGRCCS
jgi:hypothetical protein